MKIFELFIWDCDYELKDKLSYKWPINGLLFPETFSKSMKQLTLKILSQFKFTILINVLLFNLQLKFSNKNLRFYKLV